MTGSYEPQLFKFSGAGNDFIVLDGRRADRTPFRDPVRIGRLCRKYHTDGLMILAEGPLDFTMEFYNPDGSGGMMCGNGGRCIVAFADYLGIRPADGTAYRFLAPDGEHTAEILSKKIPGQAGNDGNVVADSERPSRPSWIVRLKMIDVQGITLVKGGYFLNTGTRHFVQFVPDVDSLDMEADAKPIRWDAAFRPEGTNVNFVEAAADGLHVRTFEKGVEGETLACGTGLTASALAAFKAGIPSAGQIPGQAGNDETVQAGNDGECHGRHRSAISYRLQCRRGDWLQVDFQPGPEDSFTDVYLTGPAEWVPINSL